MIFDKNNDENVKEHQKHHEPKLIWKNHIKDVIKCLG